MIPFFMISLYFRLNLCLSFYCKFPTYLGNFEYANNLLRAEVESLQLACTNNAANEDYYGAMIDDVLGVASNLSSKSQWNEKGKKANLNMYVLVIFLFDKYFNSALRRTKFL